MNDEYRLPGGDEDSGAPAEETAPSDDAHGPAETQPLIDADASPSAGARADWQAPEADTPDTLIPLDDATSAEPIPLAEIPAEEALPRQETQPTGTSSPEEETPAAVELLPFEDYLVYGSPADEPLPLDPLPFDSTPGEADAARAAPSVRRPAATSQRA